jgi:hypothetical protein
VVNYTSTYIPYAQNEGIDLCQDSDGDGVNDVADLDDDNDGVPDLQEGCLPSALDMRTVTWTAADATMNVTAPDAGSLRAEGSGWREQVFQPDLYPAT